jgi:magnesium-transporting ATPase (P-type)
MTAVTLGDYQNILYAGTVMVTGVARGVVLQTGADTEFGKVVRLSNEVKEPLSPLQKEIDYTAKINLIVAVVVGAVFFAVALAFVHLTLLESLLFAIGVMVSLVPEGFQLTVSLSLALTASAMAKKNVVVKRLSSVETVGLMTTLGTDKTGTITSGEMMVQKVWSSGMTFEVTGDGYSPEGFVTHEGRKTNREERPHILRLFEVAAHCVNAKLNPPSDRIGRWSVLGDPTDGAFLVFAGKGDFNVSQTLAEDRRLLLIPFNSQRRMMTAVFRRAEGSVVAFTKGASEEVLSRCTKVYQGDETIHITGELMDQARGKTDEFARLGYRVLALASRTLEGWTPDESSANLERDMTFLGLAALADPPRPGVAEAVAQARMAGIKIVMLTGDHELTADAVARKVGIATKEGAAVVSGAELRKMGDTELADLMERDELVFARIAPEEKLRLVKALQSKGETVAVTGDGVNDAPALKEADVGISMGAGGTDVARESADMVLLDNNFASIIEGVKLGRATLENLRNFVYYVFTHNWAELFTFLVFILFRVPLPLSVMQVLAIDLAMDVFPSLSLIMEPPSSGVMEKKAKDARDRLIDGPILIRSLVVGSAISAWVLFWAFHIWMSGGWVLGMAAVPDAAAYARGTTAVMAGIMAAQLGNMLSARTGSRPASKSGMFRNKWTLLGILCQIGTMLVIVYVPFVQPVFGTAGLSAYDWLALYAMAPVTFLLGEATKVLRHQRGSRGPQ